MRKTFLFILLALLLTSCADVPGGNNGGSHYSLTLAWDSSLTAGVVGYKVHIGKASGDYYRMYNVGNVLTYTVKNLEPGTYYFTCTAYDALGYESGYSNELRTTLSSN